MDASGRSTKAGRLTPATRISCKKSLANQGSLNEGREINPGDTIEYRRRRGRKVPRSTKAGRLTPATPGVAVSPTALASSAQRRPGD